MLAGRWSGGCSSRTVAGTEPPVCLPRWHSPCAGPTGTPRSGPSRPRPFDARHLGRGGPGGRGRGGEKPVPGLNAAELAAHRKLAGLGLRQLAPTVLVSCTPLDKTLAALRATGYAPVAETADGTVRVEQAPRRRAAAPVPHPRPPLGTRARAKGTPAVVDVSALAARLRAAPPIAPAPGPAGGIPFGTNTDTEEIVADHARLLSLADVRHAIDEGQAVTIEYVAASGSRTVRTLGELDLDPPYLYAWCHLRGDESVFALSRIHGVMPA
ncbi:hypothetical protein OG978_21460 [Streptomyces sp. NBC_01591]|uniref:WYL domain-containing protein n=1 Tax=Streptomyces sp. NBC_01591 TaxID=2975888 RepID=UPI002DD8C755|nr:WYL domain-containing protein [Streptomyces sp. NBC_01591]WSD69724.1 hypothetical protein OG978_21460 [Streptomyces sp. NBC_01591]